MPLLLVVLEMTLKGAATKTVQRGFSSVVVTRMTADQKDLSSIRARYVLFSVLPSELFPPPLGKKLARDRET